MLNSKDEKKVDELLKKLTDVGFALNDSRFNEKEHKKLLKERAELVEKARKYGIQVPALQVNQVPISSSTNTSGESSGWGSMIRNWTGYGKSREDDEIDRLYKEQQAQRQRADKERRERLAEESAAMEEKIRRTAEASKARNMESVHQVAEEKKREEGVLARERDELYQKKMEDERLARDIAREQEDHLRRERERTEKDVTHKTAQLRREFTYRDQQEEQLSETSRLDNQRKLQEQLDSYDKRKDSLDREQANLDEKVAREREEQRSELHRLDEEVRRVREESRRKYDEMEKAAREQLELIMEMLEKVQWSRAIERNWEIRIKALKSTEKRVERSIAELRTQLAIAKGKGQNPQIIRKRIDQVKDELAEIVKVMDRESENLDKMFQYSRKQFVVDVSSSLKSISTTCKSFTEYLNKVYPSDFQKAEARSAYDKVEDFEQQISRVYRDIPTLSSLKVKYSGDWQDFEASGAITDGSDDGHVIIIEEVD